MGAASRPVCSMCATMGVMRQRFGREQAAAMVSRIRPTKPSNCRGVLPDGVYRAANAGQQLNADADFRFLDRYAEVRHRTINGLQQGTIGDRQGAVGMFGGFAEAVRTEQFHQQRGARRCRARQGR